MFLSHKMNSSKGMHRSAMKHYVLLSVLAALAFVAAPHSTQAMEQAAGADVGTIWWAELRTRDPQKTQAFYSSVFGWTPKVEAQGEASDQANTAANTPASTGGQQPYTIFTANGQEVAGAEAIPPNASADARPGWLTYVQVADVDEAARKALENGGKIIQLPVDVPSVGRMAEIEDPEGNRVGLVSPNN